MKKMWKKGKNKGINKGLCLSAQEYQHVVEVRERVLLGCEKAFWRNDKDHRNESRNPCMSLSKSGSERLMDSIFLMEWMTVEWCLPPKLFPISGKLALVRDLERYIAIWRGRAMDLELLRARRSEVLRL